MQSTRDRLLTKTFQEMFRHGFQGTRIDVILEKTGVAKGALYHHFKDKTDLGYAVVDEVLRNLTIETWIHPFENSEDPIEGLTNVILGVLQKPGKQIIQTGCPLNNLAQEMSAIDEGFRKRIDDIYKLWRKAIADALKRGQDKNIVRNDVQCDKVATFIVASIAGCLGTVKNSRDEQLLKDCGESLINYLESLRTQ